MSVSVDDTSQAQAEFTAVMNGGENFLARVKALSSVRDANLKAVDDLKLGMLATDAHAAAQKALKEAQDARSEALGVLDRAKVTAAGIVAKANQEASSMLAGATEEADEAKRRARATIQAADLYSSDTRTKADKIMANAEKVRQDLAAQQKAATDAEAAHLAAEQEHAAAASVAKSHAETFRRRVEHLQAAIQSAAAMS